MVLRRRLGQQVSDPAAYYGGSNITVPEPLDVRGNDDGSHGAAAAASNPQQQHITVVGYLVIAGFLVIIALVVLLIVARYMQRRHRENSRDAPYHPTRKATKIRIQRRYETIEHWIISKQAVPHDDFCDAVISNFCHHKKKKCTTEDVTPEMEI